MKTIGKICFIIPSLSEGGAERVVSVLSSALAESGYEVLVIKYYSMPSEYPISDKVHVRCLSGGGQEDYKRLGYFKKIRMLRELLIIESPEYVVPFLPHVAEHTCFAARGLKIKDIQTVRATPNLSPRNRIRRVFRDYLIGASFRTFVQTAEQKKYFNPKYWNKIHVIPNPITDQAFQIDRAKSENLTRIISAGRLSKQKNFPLVIDAVTILHQKGYPVSLSIFGVGELKGELESHIARNNCQDFCSLRGRSESLAEMYRDADIFVLSSNYEGMPNALMEAMAAGLPCISTDCETGPRDLLCEGNGLLIPVSDLDALVRALMRMMDNLTEANEMGAKAKRYAFSHFNPNTIAARFIEMIGDAE